MSTIEILQNSLGATDETPPPMPDGIYIPSDAEVEAYMLSKLRQVKPYCGYAKVGLTMNVLGESRPTFNADAYTRSSLGTIVGSTLTEAVFWHNEKSESRSKPIQLREQAAKLIAEAEELEAKS